MAFCSPRCGGVGVRCLRLAALLTCWRLSAAECPALPTCEAGTSEVVTETNWDPEKPVGILDVLSDCRCRGRYPCPADAPLAPPGFTPPCRSAAVITQDGQGLAFVSRSTFRSTFVTAYRFANPSERIVHSITGFGFSSMEACPSTDWVLLYSFCSSIEPTILVLNTWTRKNFTVTGRNSTAYRSWVWFGPDCGSVVAMNDAGFLQEWALPAGWQTADTVTVQPVKVYSAGIDWPSCYLRPNASAPLRGDMLCYGIWQASLDPANQEVVMTFAVCNQVLTWKWRTGSGFTRIPLLGLADEVQQWVGDQAIAISGGNVLLGCGGVVILVRRSAPVEDRIATQDWGYLGSSQMQKIAVSQDGKVFMATSANYFVVWEGMEPARMIAKSLHGATQSCGLQVFPDKPEWGTRVLLVGQQVADRFCSYRHQVMTVFPRILAPELLVNAPKQMEVMVRSSRTWSLFCTAKATKKIYSQRISFLSVPYDKKDASPMSFTLNKLIPNVQYTVACNAEQQVLGYDVDGNFGNCRVFGFQSLFKTEPLACDPNFYLSESLCLPCPVRVHDGKRPWKIALGVHECCQAGFAWNGSTAEELEEFKIVSNASTATGFARLHATRTQGHMCFPKTDTESRFERCPGGPFEAQCDPRYRGTLCQACMPGTRRTRQDRCERCAPSEFGAAGTMLLVIAVGVGFGIRFILRASYWFRTRMRLRALSGRPFELLVWTQLAQQVPILLTFAQMAGTTHSSNRSSSRASTSKIVVSYVTSVFGDLQITPEGIRDVFRFDCGLGVQNSAVFIALLRPLLIPVALLLLWPLCWSVRRMDLAVKGSLLLVNVLLVGGVTAAANLVLSPCQEVDARGDALGEYSYMKVLPFVTCQSGDPLLSVTAAIGWFSLAFQGILVPLSVAALLYQYEKHARSLVAGKLVSVAGHQQTNRIVVNCSVQTVEQEEKSVEDMMETPTISDDSDSRIVASAYMAAFHVACGSTTAVLTRTMEGLRVAFDEPDRGDPGTAIELGATLLTQVREHVAFCLATRTNKVLSGASSLFFKYRGGRAVVADPIMKVMIVLVSALARTDPSAAAFLAVVLALLLLLICPYFADAMNYVAAISFFSLATMFLVRRVCEGAETNVFCRSGEDPVMIILYTIPFVATLVLAWSPDSIFNLAVRLHGKLCLLTARQLDPPGVCVQISMVRKLNMEERAVKRAVAEPSRRSTVRRTLLGLAQNFFGPRFSTTEEAEEAETPGAPSARQEPADSPGDVELATVPGSRPQVDVYDESPKRPLDPQAHPREDDDDEDHLAAAAPILSTGGRRHHRQEEALLAEAAQVVEILDEMPAEPPPFSGLLLKGGRGIGKLRRLRSYVVVATRGKIGWRQCWVSEAEAAEMAQRYGRSTGLLPVFEGCFDIFQDNLRLEATTATAFKIVAERLGTSNIEVTFEASGAAMNSQGWLRVLRAHALHGRRQREATILSPGRELGPKLAEKKTLELAHRGITLGHILEFYERLGRDVMLHFDPELSTTDDVVRQAIIPLTSISRSAYSTLASTGAPVRPRKMVTHNWGNRFACLVAAVIADALDLPAYQSVFKLLEPTRIDKLKWFLHQMGRWNYSYWICAFCVNQHSGICAGFGSNDDGQPRYDSTGVEMTRCKCGLPKHWSGDPCEMNKFDEMMGWLGTVDLDFAQVVALDPGYQLFSRAWCQAELIEANRLRLGQSLKYHSPELLRQSLGMLKVIDLRSCEASVPKDKEAILAKVADIDAFNAQLRELVLDERSGLLSSWQRDANVAEEWLMVGAGGLTAALMDE